MCEKPFKDDSIKVLFLLLLDACIEITVMKEKKKRLLLFADLQFQNVERLFMIDENLETIYLFKVSH